MAQGNDGEQRGREKCAVFRAIGTGRQAGIGDGTMSVEGEIIARRRALTNDELLFQIAEWEKRVESCSGFASAKEAALQLKWYVLEAQSRGLQVTNKYPIVRG